MRALLALLLALPAVAGLLAAPVPKELRKPKVEHLFGKPDDASGACTYTMDGDALRIAMPGTIDAVATALKNTPRTARAVEGDFTAVAVVRYAPPKPGEVPPTGHLGAGLAAWVDDEFYAMVNRHHWPTGGAGWNGGFDTHSKAPGGGVVSHGAVGEGIAPADAGHLRIVRRGNELETFYSTDGGENWVSTGKVEGTWPGNLAVGVVGFNTTKLDAEAVFDSLTVTK